MSGERSVESARQSQQLRLRHFALAHGLVLNKMSDECVDLKSGRAIVFAGGVIPRAAPGTLVSRPENLGRELFTVDFDSGQKVILFAHEIEVVCATNSRPSEVRPGQEDRK
jgi:hypothetical protein